MPDFRLSPRARGLRKTVGRSPTTSSPVIGDYYERHAFPYDIVRQMGDMGLFGLPFPEEYGGMGGDYFALCLAIEELARVDSSVAITLEAGVSRGDADLPVRHRAEAAVAAGLTAQDMLGAFGLTEASSGSDAGDISTTAVLDGDSGSSMVRRVFHHQLGYRHHQLVTVTARTEH